MQNFKDKKVLIFGLGLNDGGLGMTEFFVDQGANVTVTDGKTKEELKSTLDKLERYEDKITYHLGGHIEEDFRTNDIIIRNPGVRRDNKYLGIAREEGKEIYMEMAFFHKYCPCPIIGITGTRGKSTTSSLIYEFLKQKYGDKVLLLGNIGKSAIRELNTLKEDNLVVVELSSFQLDGMGEAKISPQTAVVTNMYKDHLNWHTDMDDYIETKKNIFKYQKEEDLLVVNMDNDITKEFHKEAISKVKTYSLLSDNYDYYLENNIVYENSKEILRIEELALEGEHNLYNILSAIATVRSFDIDKEQILNVLKNFAGVKGRQQFVKEINGIRFYNDTTATSVEAVLAMLNRFGEDNTDKIIMIAGGVDKGLEYNRIVRHLQEYLKALVLFEGTASEKIAEYIGDSIDTYSYFDNMQNAVDKAYEIAEPGDMVILCPGGSSFNMFANEFDRGDQFIEAVEQLN